VYSVVCVHNIVCTDHGFHAIYCVGEEQRGVQDGTKQYSQSAEIAEGIYHI